MSLAKQSEQCAVCSVVIPAGKAIYKWKPAAAEAAAYKTVHVHSGCRLRLIDGDRPDGVVRRGLTEAEAFELVVRCESLRLRNPTSLEGDETWSAHQPSTDEPRRQVLKRDVRAARLPHAQKLQEITESIGVKRHKEGREQFLTFSNLSLTIDYIQRNHMTISQPTDVIKTVQDLHARDRLHTLTPVTDDLF